MKNKERKNFTKVRRSLIIIIKKKKSKERSRDAESKFVILS